jgi:hypothetical protein
MNKTSFTLIMACIVCSTPAFSQSISPSRGTSTVCPGQAITYTVNPNPNFSDCGNFTWTLTNGSFDFGANPPTTSRTTTTNSIVVFWTDTPADGTLKVTSTCSEGPMIVTEKYAIRSLKTRTPANARANQTPTLCSTTGIDLYVDVMFLNNTGGTTGITQEYADGYEWVLPSGWKSSGQSGTITTTTNYIAVTPDHGCAEGSVTVKAFKSGCTSGKKYSESASISLARPRPTLTITPQAGYSGPSCGAAQAVTFTVTPISCASNYTWSFPSGWSPASVTSGSNSVTVTPSGGANDAGNIVATANLSCGITVPSATKTLTFSPPAIVVNSSICHSGTNVSMSNVSSNVTVTWNPTYNMEVISGQYTSSAIIRAIHSEARETGVINATVSCPNTSISPKNVWLGRPYDLLVSGSNYVTAGSENFYQAVPWNAQPSFADQGVAESGLTWYFPLVSTNGGWGCYNCVGSYTWVISGPQSTYVSVQAQNACGTATKDYEVFVQQQNCPPGGCEDPFIVFPNPTDNLIHIRPADTKASSRAILRDLNGNVVAETNFVGTENDLTLDVKSLPNGIYSLTVSNGKTSYKRQVMVRH